MNNKSFSSSEDILILDPGETLMRQGEQGECAYLLLSGKVKVQRESQHEKILIREVSPIELLGELAIFADNLRSATVIVTEKAELVRINKHRLRQIIRRSPDIAEIVIKILCNRLQANAEKIFEIESSLHKLSPQSISWPLGETPQGQPKKSEEDLQEKNKRMATINRRKPSP